jgi:8-oxo-dGTP pyrophosphatase MutT (NUDIX family)
MYCNDKFRQEVTSNLSDFEHQAISDASLKQAAVAVVICDLESGSGISGMPAFDTHQNDAALLLTKRSSKLRRHAGQWALPGGRVDQGETLEQTAIREMREEIGLSLDESHIVGRLDDFETRSGFIMTPVIFWAGQLSALTPDYDEVDSIHRIPVSEFMRKDAPMLSDSEHGEAPVLRMPVGDTWIAAPTAAILLQFREVCVLGKRTRVAHFDQPEFAWK